MNPNQAALAQQLRMPLAAGPGTDLRSLEDVMAAKQREIEREIQTNVEKHIRWNEGFVDKTMAPLTPDRDHDVPPSSGHFREAMAATEYLPTPPASVSDDESQPHGGDAADVEMKDASPSLAPFRYASPPAEDSGVQMPSFRRRIGRGGRVMFDRKFPPRFKRDVPTVDDRFRFDSDDDDVDDTTTITEADDDLTYARMSQRAYYIGGSRALDAAAPPARRQQQLEVAGPSHSPASLAQIHPTTVS